MAGKKAKIRLWSETPLAAGREVMLNDKQSHYLTNVMKLAAGDAVLAFDNEHGEFLCTLKTAGKKSCLLEVSEQTRGFEKCPDVWLLFAPVKKDQTDFIIQKATELGAAKIMPVITARTIADKVKKERFIAQSTEAAEQCRRVDLPVIADAEPLDKVLKTWDKERVLYFMDETGQSPCAAEVFRSQNKKAALLIGPEGGFSEAELNTLRTLPFARGAVLGKRILRAETAAAAALAVWQSVAGDWREE